MSSGVLGLLLSFIVIKMCACVSHLFCHLMVADLALTWPRISFFSRSSMRLSNFILKILTQRSGQQLCASFSGFSVSWISGNFGFVVKVLKTSGLPMCCTTVMEFGSTRKTGESRRW